MTLTTLVTGADYHGRECAIASAIRVPGDSAVILEGLPSGNSALDPLSELGTQVIRVAPACMCCIGNLTLRVTLNRVLRNKPALLYLALASTEHLQPLRDFLTSPPYDQHIRLAPELHL